MDFENGLMVKITKVIGPDEILILVWGPHKGPHKNGIGLSLIDFNNHPIFKIQMRLFLLLSLLLLL